MATSAPQNPTQLPPRALGLMALGAFCISFAAPLVKLASAGPSAIGFYRVAIGAITLLLLTLLTTQKEVLRAGLRNRTAVAWAVAAGAAFAFDLFLWHRSVLLIGAGLATLIANTQVFWVAILSAWILRDKLSWKFAISAVIAITGIATLTGPGIVAKQLSVPGVAYGLGAAILFAIYLLCLRASQTSPTSLPAVPNLAVVSVTSAIGLLVLALATGEAVGTPTKADILPSLALGIGVHVGGWLAISTAIPKLPAAMAAMMILLQPIFATVWGILFFSEPFGPLDAFGATLTLAGIYLATTGPRKAASSPEPTEMVTEP